MFKCTGINYLRFNLKLESAHVYGICGCQINPGKINVLFLFFWNHPTMLICYTLTIYTNNAIVYYAVPSRTVYYNHIL